MKFTFGARVNQALRDAQGLEQARLLDVLTAMPPKLAPDPDHPDPTKIRCACNRLVPMDRVRGVIDTGHIKAIDPVCACCLGDLADNARLVCATCRQVVGYIPEQRDRHGFEIRRDKCYHIRHCGVCKKGLIKAKILEMVVFYEAMGIPYEP